MFCCCRKTVHRLVVAGSQHGQALVFLGSSYRVLVICSDLGTLSHKITHLAGFSRRIVHLWYGRYLTVYGLSNVGSPKDACAPILERATICC